MRSLLWGAAAGILSLSASTGAGEMHWYVSLEGGVSVTSADGAQIAAVSSFSFGAPFSGPSLAELSTPDGAAIVPGGMLVDLDRLEIEEGASYFAAVGTHLYDNFRLELELGRRSADVGNAELGQTSLMLNAMFDVPIIKDVTLSLGAGAGFDLIDVGSESAAEPALQVKAGVAYAITESTDIMLNYRYMSATGSKVGDFPIGAIGETRVEDVTDSAVTVGVRFGF